MMKRCPDCYEVYDKGENFCELDGRQLLVDPSLGVDAENVSPDYDDPQSKREPWLIGFVGALVGIFICAVVYVAFALWSFDPYSRDQEAPVQASQMRENHQSLRPAPARMAEADIESPEDPSSDPEAEDTADVPLEAAASPDNHTVAAHLNEGPVSTGQRVKADKEDTEVRTIIQMKDATTVEVDAAWEDGQGVWYRRGGLVSFVESHRVKAITARAEQKSPSPDNTAPAP